MGLGGTIIADLMIMKYMVSNRRPWTMGYGEYKERAIHNILNSHGLLNSFLHNKPLPAKYGFRIDERIVEYPWLFSRLGVKKNMLLDAGSALNHKNILSLPALKSRSIVIYNLSAENIFKNTNISYVYGDLRNTILKDDIFDEIACISTLEHIGMDNTFIYSKDERFNESRSDDYKTAIKEFKRLLKPGGKLFITVPYGCYENHGWLQQFDCNMIKEVLQSFNSSASVVVYYKYSSDGWQISDSEECADCSYFNIHNRPDYEPDYVAAARSVACIEMVK